MQQFHHYRRKTTINSLQIPTTTIPHIPSPIPSPFYSYTRHSTPTSSTNPSDSTISKDIDEILTYAAKHFRDQWSSFTPLFNTPLSYYIPSLPKTDTDTLALPIHTSQV